MAEYDGQVVRFAFNDKAWECIVKYTGMRTVEVNFINDTEAVKNGWQFVPSKGLAVPERE